MDRLCMLRIFLHRIGCALFYDLPENVCDDDVLVYFIYMALRKK